MVNAPDNQKNIITQKTTYADWDSVVMKLDEEIFESLFDSLPEKCQHIEYGEDRHEYLVRALELLANQKLFAGCLAETYEDVDALIKDFEVENNIYSILKIIEKSHAELEKLDC